jgi:hypothetical protein
MYKTILLAAGILLGTTTMTSAAEPPPLAYSTGTILVDSPYAGVPVVKRPYRVGHILGNSVRRRYHRGGVLTLPPLVQLGR